MMKAIDDVFSIMQSSVRFEPTASFRFISDEIRRYGIKTNQTNDRGQTIFYQSAHIIATYDRDNGETVAPRFALVGFKDLFKLIGKNAEGADKQDISRVWKIANKLESRDIISILGTAKEILDDDEAPDEADSVFANLCYIHQKDDKSKEMTYKSKFATNKAYKTVNGKMLYGIADYFLIV
jgi:hypothetical protein